MCIAGLFQCTADETDIVGCTAAAAGLADDHGKLVRIVFAGQDGVHNLSYYDERRIAGIVIYIFETGIYGVFIIVLQYFDLIARFTESRLNEIEVDR